MAPKIILRRKPAPPGKDSAHEFIQNALGVPPDKICNYPIGSDLTELVFIVEHLQETVEDPLGVLRSFLNQAVESNRRSIQLAVGPEDIELVSRVFLHGERNPFEKKRARDDNTETDETPSVAQPETGPALKKLCLSGQRHVERLKVHALSLESELREALRTQDSLSEKVQEAECELGEARANEAACQRDWDEAQRQMEESKARKGSLEEKSDRLDYTIRTLEGLRSGESSPTDQKLGEMIELYRKEQALCDEDLRQAFWQITHATWPQVHTKWLEAQKQVQHLEMMLKTTEKDCAAVRETYQHCKIVLQVSRLGPEGWKDVVQQFPGLEDGLEGAYNRLRDGDVSEGEDISSSYDEEIMDCIRWWKGRIG